MKNKKIIAFLIVVPAILFTLYIAKYQALIKESSALSDQHCLDVNPLIIERREKYIESLQVATLNTDLAVEAMGEYLNLSKEYVKAEKQWLKKQEAFLNRWDVQMFLDRSVQEAGKWQYRIYEADYRSIDAVTRALGTKDTKEHDRLIQLSQQATKDGKYAQTEYTKLWKNRPTNFDIRNYFLTIPPSRCPDENFDIPDVR